MGRSGWRPHIESALCLDLRQVMKIGAVVPNKSKSGELTWTRGKERIASLGYTANLGESDGVLTLRYRADGQDWTDAIRLSTVSNHYGGRNWFMHCPASGRRARKLYKWAELPHFRHREAVRPRPTYASQRDSGCERLIRQRWALRRQIGDRWSDLFGEPVKPKWMRWDTFQRCAARDEELAGRESIHFARLLGLGRRGKS